MSGFTDKVRFPIVIIWGHFTWLGSEISSLQSKTEQNLVHTEGSAKAQLRLSSDFSEPSPKLSQCEMPHCVRFSLRK